MAEVVVYSSPWCPYCSRAKKLLNEKGIQFEEIDVMMQPRKRVEMTEKAEGRTTVPQIFIDGKPIGGCDDLYARPVSMCSPSHVFRMAVSGEIDGARHITLNTYFAISDRSPCSMAEVVVYSSPWCPYCTRAKKLLDEKGVQFEEIDVMMQPRKRVEMTEKAEGRTTVPQIFIDGKPIGGCDDLYALDRAGKLDPMLGRA